MTDLPRQEFGRLIVARFADEDDRVSPLPMLFRAAADSEARAVAQRLLRDRVFEPLQKWFGGDGADVKAARFMMVSRSEEHTSELQSLMRISYAGLCLKKKNVSKSMRN